MRQVLLSRLELGRDVIPHIIGTFIAYRYYWSSHDVHADRLSRPKTIQLVEPRRGDIVLYAILIRSPTLELPDLVALVNATVELLTRDAHLIAWYRQEPLARVSLPEVADASIQRSLAWQKSHGIRFELFDLEASTLPGALLGRLTSEQEHPNWPKGGVAFILSGGFSLEEAFSRVLNHSSLRLLNLVAAPSKALDPRDPEIVARVARRHPYYSMLARYLDPRNSDACSFIDGRKTNPPQPTRVAWM